jgi:hypothetical protein
MAKDAKNIAASVHQRYTIERFIYRLSKSPHANSLILRTAKLSDAPEAFGDAPQPSKFS